LAIGLKHGPAHHGSAHDDQVREKPTGLPKSSASVMGIKLEKSNGHMDKSTALNQIEEEIRKSSYHRGVL
jgi:hypothetical protein